MWRRGLYTADKSSCGGIQTVVEKSSSYSYVDQKCHSKYICQYIYSRYQSCCDLRSPEKAENKLQVVLLFCHQ